MKSIFIFFIIGLAFFHCLAEKKSDGSELGLDFDLDEQSFINSAPINSEPAFNNEDQQELASDIKLSESSEPSLYDQFIGNEEDIIGKQQEEENLNIESITSPKEILQSLENDQDLLGFTNKKERRKGKKYKQFIHKRKLRNQKKVSKEKLDQIKSHEIKPSKTQKQIKVSEQLWKTKYKQQNNQQQFLNKRKLHKHMRKINQNQQFQNHKRYQLRKPRFSNQKRKEKALKQEITINQAFNKTFFHESDNQLIINNAYQNKNSVNINYGSVDVTENNDIKGSPLKNKLLMTSKNKIGGVKRSSKQQSKIKQKHQEAKNKKIEFE